MTICHENNLILLKTQTQALGSKITRRLRELGLWLFEFYPAKILGGPGDGGNLN